MGVRLHWLPFSGHQGCEWVAKGTGHNTVLERRNSATLTVPHPLLHIPDLLAHPIPNLQLESYALSACPPGLQVTHLGLKTGHTLAD